MYQSVKRPIAALVVSLPLVLSAGIAQAACKGQPEAACAEAAACTWVSGYARKDGVEVSGYCRNRGSRGKAQGATPDQAKLTTEPATPMR